MPHGASTHRSASTLPGPGPRLAALIARLEACGNPLDVTCVEAILKQAELAWEDVAPYVEENERSYARRRVARTEAFEVLVMTWRPGQGSPPHDHAGSGCTLKILRGEVSETRFRFSPDGLVDPAQTRQVTRGEIVVDGERAIHRLANEPGSNELLVTLHVYAPPLAELRRYVPRPNGAAPAALFQRRPNPDTPRVVVVGGGFSGTMVAAQLLQHADASRLHVVLLERHSSFGEGAAYRTADPRHLLNVPAAKMSAWPDRPNDFLDWARTRHAEVGPDDFLPRCLFGEYLRSAFSRAASAAGEGISAEIRQEDACEVRQHASGWRVRTSSGTTLDAAAVVLATGHRPPDDPFGSRWHGSRARLIADPWASLALASIRPDEPVVVLGTGLTALDALLTLGREPRSAPITAVSRRGLLPAAHVPSPGPPTDPSGWLVPLLSARGGPTALGLLAAVRAAIDTGERAGVDWRSILDGLRPHLPAIWGSLSPCEAARWLRHVRPFWEVHRHRMAPSIARAVDGKIQDGSFRTLAGRVLSARGDLSGVTLQVRPRGAASSQELQAAWVINCTGPGVDARTGTEPSIASLLEAGHLQPDAFGLGVLTGPSGEARSRAGRQRSDLLVVGTLRKPQLWESTAIPELRVQAADAAAKVLAHLASLRAAASHRSETEARPAGGVTTAPLTGAACSALAKGGV